MAAVPPGIELDVYHSIAPTWRKIATRGRKYDDVNIVLYSVSASEPTYASEKIRFSGSPTSPRSVARGPRRTANAAIHIMDAKVKVVANFAGIKMTIGKKRKMAAK